VKNGEFPDVEFRVGFMLFFWPGKSRWRLPSNAVAARAVDGDSLLWIVNMGGYYGGVEL